MKFLFHKFTKTLGHLTDVLVAFGPFGLFALAALDSSFVPLPSSADALMLVLTAAHPHWMVLYALAATAGSALGCLVLYYVSRRAGSRALARFSESKQKRVKDLIDRYDVLSVLVASLLPPPFPFKLFVVCRGRIVDNFLTLINPEIPIPRFVVALTGITNEMVRTAPVFAEVAPKWLDFVADAVLIAHNAPFDTSFFES